MFKRRRFPVEIILLCVRWHCKYGISFWDLCEMTQERTPHQPALHLLVQRVPGRQIVRHLPPRRAGMATQRSEFNTALCS